MLLHYLKVALRNLWKYKAHSIISVLCLAVGITFYTAISLFLGRFGVSRDLPGGDRRVEVTGMKYGLSLENIDYIHSLHIEEIDSLIVGSSVFKGEIGCIDGNQRELPYIASYMLANNHFLKGYGLEVVAGDASLQKKDEVVISEKFAQRVFGGENPIGMSIRLPKLMKDDLEIYRIAGVVSGIEFNDYRFAEIYFPLSSSSRFALSAEAIVKPGVDMQAFKQRMREILLEPGNPDSFVYIQDFASRYQEFFWIELVGLCIGSLILLSGLVNFLKFLIQLFYNRQRELAIRKCVGSGVGGLFTLLFTECFCMMTVALLISMCLSEICYVFACQYLLDEVTGFFQLTDVYWIQFKTYLVVLLVCLVICLYPVWRIRRTSVIRMVMVGTRRHVFRNVMIGVQMAISLLFVGGSIVTLLVTGETWNDEAAYLTEEEEERILMLKVNSNRMDKNLNAILSDIQEMPEVEAHTYGSHDAGKGWFVEQYMNDDRSWYVIVQHGSPDYFRFFHVPVEGKEVAPDATNMVYVSRSFYEQLQKDSVEGTVVLGGQEYQIAGVYEKLYKEGNQGNQYIGSAYFVNRSDMYQYFRLNPQADVQACMKKLETICRKYVPETLPLEIRRFSDDAKTIEATISTISYAFLILGAISLLVVVLSIYSAISMDTISRQKEVAIRKINGATPKVIAWMFGRIYILTYLIVFAFVFPVGRLVATIAFQGYDAPYRWDWVVGIFIGIALLIFAVTAYKIYRIMHLNPATIIKKE